MKRRALAILSLACALTPALARADGEQNKADAQAAFELGRKLVLEGKFADACPKFEESERLDPGIGTMLFLADCYEKIGKSASAWGQFREAEAIAGKQQDSRERIAHDRAAALEPKLSKVIVKVGPAQKVDGMHVTRDGDDIGAGLWNTPLPIDPGDHTIGANAPGKKSWSEHVTIVANASTVTVVVPALLDDPNASAAAVGLGVGSGSGNAGPEPGPETPAKDGKGQRLLALGAVGLGVVGVGVGSVFGILAKSKNDASNSDGHCHDGNHCDQTGVDDRTAAKTDATVSTIAFIAGGVFIAGGAVLYLTAPHGKKSAATIAPAVGPKTAGLSLSASW